MVLQRELFVYDWMQNILYRSISCVRCNNVVNFFFWGFDVFCIFSSLFIFILVNIIFVKKFVKEYLDCFWKYVLRNKNQQQYKLCVLYDVFCVLNLYYLLVLFVFKELCLLYFMVFLIDLGLRFRNFYCVFCGYCDGIFLGGNVDVGYYKFLVVVFLLVFLDVSVSI